MKLADVNPIYKEALAAFEIFRKLRFPSELIYFTVVDGCVAIQVRTQPRDTIVVLDPVPASMDAAALEAGWVEAAGLWNTATQLEMRDVAERARVRRSAVKIIADMHLAGIVFPKEEAWRERKDGAAMAALLGSVTGAPDSPERRRLIACLTEIATIAGGRMSVGNDLLSTTGPRWPDVCRAWASTAAVFATDHITYSKGYWGEDAERVRAEREKLRLEKLAEIADIIRKHYPEEP